jgi:hypothetical protein
VGFTREKVKGGLGLGEEGEERGRRGEERRDEARRGEERRGGRGGRAMLRADDILGRTIAIGKVTKLIENKESMPDVASLSVAA